MVRFFLAMVLLTLAAIFAFAGGVKLWQEHQLMAAAKPIDAVVTGISTRETKGSKGSTNYHATITVEAQTPEGPLLSRFVDSSLATEYKTSSRRARNRWLSQFSQGAVVQAWYVSPTQLSPTMRGTLGTGRPAVFLEKAYVAGHVFMAAASVSLLAIGIAVLGNKGGTKPSSKPAPGSDPPVRMLKARRWLVGTAITRTTAAVICTAGTILLVLLFAVGATGDVPQATWWFVSAVGVVSLVLALMAIANISTALRFGQPKVFIERSSLAIGRTNMVAVAALSRGKPTEPVRCTLQCERVVIVGSGKSQQVKRSVEWSQEFVGHDIVTHAAVIGSATASGGYPQHDGWQVAIPSDAQPSTKLKGGMPGYEWTIIIKQKAGGGALAVEYPVLVEVA